MGVRSTNTKQSFGSDFYRSGTDAAINPLVHGYWFSTLSGNGSDDDEPYGIAVDSEHSVYVTGWSESHTASGTTGDRDAVIAKFDLLGTLQWQRTLGGSGSDEGRAIAVDSSDNIYITGKAVTDCLIAKYDKSGSLQWQNILHGGTTTGYSIAVDSSDNVYICGRSTAGSGAPLFIAKYNSSGTLQGHRFLGNVSSTHGNSVGIDSSDNVYVFGDTDEAGAGDFDMVIVKYNSSLGIQWVRTLGDTVKEEGYGCAVDNAGNVYVTGSQNTSNNTTSAIVAKYDTSGSIQWQLSLSNPNKAALGYAIAVDNAGSVYVGGNTNNVDSVRGYDMFIAKLAASNGAITWQRTFGTSSFERLEDIFVKDNCVYACTLSGSSAGNYLITKLPADGSGTGTYSVTSGTYVYEASSLIEAYTSLTDTVQDSSTAPLIDAAGSLTSSATSLTDQTSTFSSSSDPIE